MHMSIQEIKLLILLYIGVVGRRYQSALIFLASTLGHALYTLFHLILVTTL